jgi:hypothetical protein
VSDRRGESGYLATMALLGVPPAVMKPTDLLSMLLQAIAGQGFQRG